MAIKQIKKGRFAGLWKATIDFENSYAEKGTSEYFELKEDAKYWLVRIKTGYGRGKNWNGTKRLEENKE